MGGQQLVDARGVHPTRQAWNNGDTGVVEPTKRDLTPACKWLRWKHGMPMMRSLTTQ